ncbi:MAG: DUF63 family protein [Methanoregulaceae archaeon]|nr:DUF63 family protein [Methanoregulaceae archaeon]HRX33016.1 DUF63 family protein [Methanoregulaceae archaeon]
MVLGFIYKYYIDPIRYGQPYNVVDTTTYALVLLVAIYILYRWFSRSKTIAIDGRFVLATLPYVVLGGLLRVVQDTGMITSDLQYLLITPLIYFLLFFFTAAVLVGTSSIQKAGMIRDYIPVYSVTGIVAALVAAGVLVSFGIGNTVVDAGVVAFIIGLGLLTTALVYAAMRYLLRWEYAADPLYLALIFGQMLDASATSFGIDLHPLEYVEVHVVGSNLIAWTGTAFSMFPLKLLVLFPGIYILERFRNEGSPVLWHLIVLAMITVGLAPGVRDMVRMMLYV